jgi:type I restriction enzyme S subunit
MTRTADEKLENLVDVVRGITFPTSAKKKSPGRGLVACLRTTNVQDTVEWDDLLYVDEKHIKNDAQKVRVGDILISMSNSRDLVGKCALVTSLPKRATFGAFIAVVRVRDGIDPRYVFHAMRSPRFKAHLRSIASTTTNISNINSSKLLATSIPVFGDKTRELLTSKVEELISRIEEGERALKEVQKLLANYHQSALKAAVTGELTRKWRSKHKGRLESGKVLLHRILATRRKAWETAELGKMRRGKGQIPANDAWKKEYQEPSPPDLTDLAKLPVNWIWASMGQIGIVSGGLTQNQKREALALQRPFLRVANVYKNRLDLTAVHQIGVSENELERVTLQKNDMLVVEGNGSIEQIGRVALWDGSIKDCVHQNHLIKVRFIDPLVAWYALAWCMSPHGRRQIMRVASSTAGLHTLSISKVQALPVPIPSFEELQILKDGFEVTDSLVTKYRSAIATEVRKSFTLKQAVLNAAFSGKLIAKNPSDAPASALPDRPAVKFSGERATDQKYKHRRKKAA